MSNDNVDTKYLITFDEVINDEVINSELKQTLENIKNQLNIISNKIDSLSEKISLSNNKESTINIFISIIKDVGNICFYSYHFISDKTSQPYINSKSNISYERGTLLAVYAAIQLLSQTYINDNKINIIVDDSKIKDLLLSGVAKEKENIDLMNIIFSQIKRYNIEIIYDPSNSILWRLIDKILEYKEKIKASQCLQLQVLESFQKMK